MIKRAFAHFSAEGGESDEEIDSKTQKKLQRYAMDPSLLYESDSADESAEKAWTCKCGNLVFAGKTSCPLCKKQKPESDASASESDDEAGENLDEEQYLMERNRNKFHGKHHCQLCPEKTIISDNDLANHLSSAQHLQVAISNLQIFKKKQDGNPRIVVSKLTCFQVVIHFSRFSFNNCFHFGRATR